MLNDCLRVPTAGRVCDWVLRVLVWEGAGMTCIPNHPAGHPPIMLAHVTDQRHLWRLKGHNTQCSVHTLHVLQRTAILYLPTYPQQQTPPGSIMYLLTG